jgi:capsular polysaccharide biosynthesis protein
VTSSAMASDPSEPAQASRGGWARRLTRGSWPLVILAAVCGAAIGYTLTLFIPPSYSAKVTLYVAPPISSSATDAVAGDQYATNRTDLYQQLAKNDELARRVAAEMQSPAAPAALAKRITVSAAHDAPLLTIEASGRSLGEARSLAQAYLDQLPDFARSVEQSSGLREGPVLVTVAGPITVGPSRTTGQPWLVVMVPIGVLTAVALAFVLLRVRRHPTVRSVGQLRKALAAPLIVELTGRAGEIAQFRAMLFAAPNSARRVILASARHDDTLDETIAHLKNVLSDGISDEIVEGHERGEIDVGNHSNAVIMFAATALLDHSDRITALAARANAAVVVCRKRRTPVEDVVDLAALLSLNGLDVRGILIATHRRQQREKQPLPSSADGDDTDRPWPRIDVLEAGMTGRGHRRTRS